MEHEIIIAREHHLPEVFELWKELNKVHATLDPVLLGNISEDHGMNYLRKYIGPSHEMMFVCLIKGKVEGFITATRYRKHPLYKSILYCYIYDLLVSEKHRKQGIGKALMEAVLDWAKFYQVDRIELGVAHANSQVYNFYRNFGFQDYSRQFTLNLSYSL